MSQENEIFSFSYSLLKNNTNYEFKQGAKVVICDINQAGCDANVEEMKKMGIDATGYAANLTDPEAVKELVNTIVDKYGRIVHLSSVSGKRGGGIFCGAHYSASKAAVLGFSKNLAREVSSYGITTNCVCPGLINTEIWKSLPKEQADAESSTQVLLCSE